jgi:hypothetical protein
VHDRFAVPKGENCSATFFENVVVVDLQTNLCSGTGRKTLKCPTVHLDNAPIRSSKHSRETVKATGAIRVPHPAYSPDRATSEFFFFGHLKGNLQSVAATAETT